MKVLKVLKHIFIPHDENDYKPHFFREVAVLIFLFISVFLLGSSAGSSFFIHKTVLGAEIASSVLIDLTNESRIAYNQQPLLRSSKLDEAATLKGVDMSNNEYFSHNSPTGVTPWFWFNKVGYKFLYAGENLAINFTDSSNLEEAWLNSPTHRANIMNVEFREIGMATIQGMYKNYPTIYVVQMFGTPAYGKTITEKVGTSTEEVSSISVVKEEIIPNTTNLAAGAIKGESVRGVPVSKVASSTSSTASSTASTTLPSNLEKIVGTQNLAIVKNTSVGEIPANIHLAPTKYSTWYEKLVFKYSYYIDTIYKILLLIIGIALVTMVMIELRKQHYIHILYGLSLLALLLIFIYINHSFY